MIIVSTSSNASTITQKEISRSASVNMQKIQNLQLWCKKQCQGYRDVSITNMTTSFRDGLAFCAIIHRFRPDLIDFASLKPNDIYTNNRIAFMVAETELDIAALLDAEDMELYKVPDKLCIITYVNQYHSKFRDVIPVGGPNVNAYDKDEIKVTKLKRKHKEKAADKCALCDRKVYILERHLDGSLLYHRSCFKSEREPPPPSPQPQEAPRSKVFAPSPRLVVDQSPAVEQSPISGGVKPMPGAAKLLPNSVEAEITSILKSVRSGLRKTSVTASPQQTVKPRSRRGEPLVDTSPLVKPRPLANGHGFVAPRKPTEQPKPVKVENAFTLARKKRISSPRQATTTTTPTTTTTTTVAEDIAEKPLNAFQLAKLRKRRESDEKTAVTIAVTPGNITTPSTPEVTPASKPLNAFQRAKLRKSIRKTTHDLAPAPDDNAVNANSNANTAVDTPTTTTLLDTLTTTTLLDTPTTTQLDTPTTTTTQLDTPTTTLLDTPITTLMDTPTSPQPIDDSPEPSSAPPSPPPIYDEDAALTDDVASRSSPDLVTPAAAASPDIIITYSDGIPSSPYVDLYSDISDPKPSRRPREVKSLNPFDDTDSSDASDTATVSVTSVRAPKYKKRQAPAVPKVTMRRRNLVSPDEALNGTESKRVLAASKFDFDADDFSDSSISLNSGSPLNSPIAPARRNRHSSKPVPKRKAPQIPADTEPYKDTKRKVNAEKQMSSWQLRSQKLEIDKKMRTIERRGRELEIQMREGDKLEPDDEKLWFSLINEQIELTRQEKYLNHRENQQRFESIHEDIETEIRKLMDIPEDIKTTAIREKEELLLIRLVDIVQERSKIVNMIEQDRLSYIKEDEAIAQQMELMSKLEE